MIKHAGRESGTRKLIKAPLYISFIVVCFAPLIEGGTTHVPVLFLKLLVLSMLAVMLHRWISSGEVALHKSPLDIPVVLFLVAAVLSFIITPYKYMALTWVQLIICYTLFFFMTRYALQGLNSLMQPVLVLMFMGALESVIVIVQWTSGVARPNGTFFNPNMAAGYVAVPAVFAVSLFINDDVRVKGLARKALLACIFIICIAAIMLSGSRGALLALAAGLFVVAWRRSRIHSLLLIAALAAAFLVIPNPVKDRLSSGDLFAYSRAGIWKSAARMAYDHPLGVGLGNFKYEYGKYKFPVEGAVIRYGKTARTAHNEYLHFTAEMGLPGLAVIVFGLCALAVALSSSVRDPVRSTEYPIAVGALGAVSATLVHSMVDSNLHEPGTVFMLIFTVSIGLAAGREKGRGTWKAGIPKSSCKRVALLCYALILLMAVWAIKPEAARYYFVKGTEALKTSGPSSALAPAGAALSIEPGDAVYHEQMASVMYTLFTQTGMEGQLSGALEELSEAERLNPNNSRYPEISASIKTAYESRMEDQAKSRKLVESALSDIGRALDADPFEARLLFTKANLLMRLGEMDRAEATLLRLRDLEPNFLKGRFALARLYRLSGREKLSRAECYSIIGLNETFSKRRFDPADEAFVSVDIKAVKKMLDSMKGA